MRTKLIIPLAVFCVLVHVAGASAGVVPPGNAGAIQYSETLPGPGGEETSGQGATADNPTAGQKGSGSGKEGGQKQSSVSSQVAGELRELGPEAEAALALAGAGAPAGPAPERHGSKDPKKKDDAEGEPATGIPSGLSGPDAGGGTSGLGDVLNGAVGTSSGGLGLLQPLILAIVVLGAGTYVLRRRADPTDRA